FACVVMAAGLLYCAILLAGYVAAEVNSGCCLCFYTILAMAMMLLEAAVAGHLLLNEHWMQDLPYDRTRELENLVSFVNNNLDLCKWAALATVATQVRDSARISICLFLVNLNKHFHLKSNGTASVHEPFKLVAPVVFHTLFPFVHRGGGSDPCMYRCSRFSWQLLYEPWFRPPMRTVTATKILLS
uniref:Tetraspanin n=1 Tax=Aegilops tauschii subsp. strangulata TaxID=200361 RepID=A0A453SWJ7_AEGTS